jgi:nitrite reductase/ring-hydroxylating ferredoxin subunit
MPQFEFFKIADSKEELQFPPNNLLEIPVNNRTVCLSKHQEQLHAFAPKCPHSGGYFRDGWMDALGNVVCPLHRYKFCPSNGRNVSGEGYYLKHFPLEIREDGVYVGLEKNKFFW